MKKLIIFTLICLTAVLYGQETRFTLGSKVSFGQSYIMPYRNVGFYPSWAAGLATEYLVTDKLAFGLDALYSSEGAKFKSGDLTAKTELDYLRLPIRAIYHFAESSKAFRPRISAGPTFGVYMAEGTGYKDMDFGINAALGFSYQLMSDFWLTTDVDYYHGLMDIRAGDSEKERNGNIRLNVGLMFGL
jgi:outer membrane protein W